MKRNFVISVAASAALLVGAGTAQAQRGRDDGRARTGQEQQASRGQQRQDDTRQHAAAPQQRVEQSRTEPRRADESQARQAPQYDQQRIAQERQGEQAQQREQSQQRELQQRELQQRELQQRELQQRQQTQQLERNRGYDRDQQLEQARVREEQTERARDNERLEAARRNAELQRTYDRDDDRNYRPGYDYRYNMGGVYRQTNQYGVDALRRAVNLGYQEGYRAGLDDRRDRVPADYRRAFEYQEGSYGFAGTYVPEGDYSYYFRQGFERGYEDAYGNRSQYGTYYNGTPSILGNIVAGILGLTTIR